MLLPVKDRPPRILLLAVDVRFNELSEDFYRIISIKIEII